MYNIEEIISGYLDNELTPQQEAELHHALSENEEERDIFREHIRLKQAARESLNNFVVSNDLRNNLFNRLQLEEGMSAEAVNDYRQRLKSESVAKPDKIEAEKFDFNKAISTKKQESVKQISFFAKYRRVAIAMPFVVATLFGGVFMWSSFNSGNKSELASNDIKGNVVNDLAIKSGEPQNQRATNTVSPTATTTALTDNAVGGAVEDEKNSNKQLNDAASIPEAKKHDDLKGVEKLDIKGKASSNSGTSNTELVEQAAQNAEVASPKKKVRGTVNFTRENQVLNPEAASSPSPSSIAMASNQDDNMTPSLPTNNVAEKQKDVKAEDYKVDTGGVINNFKSMKLSATEIAYLLTELNGPTQESSKSSELKDAQITAQHSYVQGGSGLSSRVGLGNGFVQNNKPSINRNSENSDFINLLVQIIKSKMQQKGVKTVTVQEVMDTADSLFNETKK